MSKPAADLQTEDFAADILDVATMESLEALLAVVCKTTGMGFAAVARVTDTRWVALAVRDEIAFGLKPGEELQLETTLCREVRLGGKPIVFDDASLDERYRDHITTRTYAISSYISVPITLGAGQYFGNLCAIDPKPAKVAAPGVVEMFELFSRLIASHVQNIRALRRAERDSLFEKANGVSRENFIAVMAHDLRNPLSAIGTGLALLQRQPGDAKRVLDAAQRMGHSVVRMRLLIDDVLDLARGRVGGGIGLDLEWVADMAVALRHVVDELGDGHPDRSVDVRIGALKPMRCDRARVQQLLSNLVANALVHGDAGGTVVVRIHTGDVALEMCVANSGTPIPADSIESVFGAFERGQARNHSGGLGLGLYICEQIALAHGGTIGVTSSAEDGTVFKATLPLAGPPHTDLDR